MTMEEKLASLRLKLSNTEDSDELLLDILEDAKEMILNKLYEVREMPDDVEMPSKYDRLQIRLAVEMFNKRGAEGESQHSENGINRQYYAYAKTLAEVKPLVGSIAKS